MKLSMFTCHINLTFKKKKNSYHLVYFMLRKFNDMINKCEFPNIGVI